MLLVSVQDGIKIDWRLLLVSAVGWSIEDTRQRDPMCAGRREGRDKELLAYQNGQLTPAAQGASWPS